MHSLYSRQRFDVAAGATPWGDTGPPFCGAVVQLRWSPTTPDTGGDVRIVLLPHADDTGGGRAVYHAEDTLGVAWTRAPMVLAYDTGGAAIANRAEPPVAAGERLRVKVTPGGAACVGALYAWIRN
jgi:hypothetical protein